MKKPERLTFVVMLIVLSLTVVTSRPALASAIKPSVPDFSLKVVAHPYDVAPTTAIDPYTGKNITTSYGYHAENKSIEITVKNQPFTSTLDSSGNFTSLYYNIRFKGHYADQWSYYPKNRNFGYTNASSSDYTTISFSLDGSSFGTVSAGGQVDFQVQALIGHDNKISWNVFLHPEFYYYEFAGEISGWSNTQMITIDGSAPDSVTETPDSSTPNAAPSHNSTVTPSQSPIAIPDQTQNSTSLPADQSDSQNVASQSLECWQYVTLALLAVIVVLLGIVLVYLRKRSISGKLEEKSKLNCA